jgi:hypothetical protein
MSSIKPVPGSRYNAYVVSLETSKPEGYDLTWIEIVEKNMKYFCPMRGNVWPKKPPNYTAF